MLNSEIVERRNRLFYSALTASIGAKLVRTMGLWCAARYLRNLGLSFESALEVLALRAKT